MEEEEQFFAFLRNVWDGSNKIGESSPFRVKSSLIFVSYGDRGLEKSMFRSPASILGLQGPSRNSERVDSFSEFSTQ